MKRTLSLMAALLLTLSFALAETSAYDALAVQYDALLQREETIGQGLLKGCEGAGQFFKFIHYRNDNKVPEPCCRRSRFHGADQCFPQIFFKIPLCHNS